MMQYLLFSASDAVKMPYSVTSGSDVMFDALVHSLPSIVIDLGFFKEFARKGLGIAVRRKPDEFSDFKVLENNYLYHNKEIENFKSNLSWDSVAGQHIRLYMDAMADSDKDQRLAPEIELQQVNHVIGKMPP